MQCVDIARQLVVQASTNGVHEDLTPAYPEESIGRLMTSEFVAVRPEFTVAEALSHIRRHGKECETLNTIYVVDTNGSLIDEIELSKIVLASLISGFLSLSGTSLLHWTLEDQELAIRQFQENDAVALPVVDDSGTLLGIVTVDDVMDIAEQESLEDFQKFGRFSTPLQIR